MKTTLNEIKKHHPCKSGWSTLLKSLNKTTSDDESLDLMTILKSNGIEDAIWCLRCFDYLDYCLFLADVAESVLPIYEAKNESKAPRNAIAAIREYKAGNIDKDQLRATAAYAAYAADAADAAVAADAAYAAAYAAYAAYAADAAYAAVAAYAAAYAAARKEKWHEIELLFIKHFSGVTEIKNRTISRD